MIEASQLMMEATRNSPSRASQRATETAIGGGESGYASTTAQLDTVAGRIQAGIRCGPIADGASLLGVTKFTPPRTGYRR